MLDGEEEHQRFGKKEGRLFILPVLPALVLFPFSILVSSAM